MQERMFKTKSESKKYHNRDVQQQRAWTLHNSNSIFTIVEIAVEIFQ